MNTTAILFPGQGSQAPLMGKDIASRYPQCMEYWKIAEEFSHLPLRSIYWEHCSEQEMLQTNALQPALTAFALSLLYCYKEHQTYTATAGHSLGEFPALCASGVLSSEDALFLTAKRGLIMNNADPEQKGSMIAILKLPLETVEHIVDTITHEFGPVIFIANYNTPAQYILSGHASIFPKVIELVTERKGRAISFPIAGAFHSPLMQKAQDDFLQYLQSITWNNPTIPFYSNVTRSSLSTASDIKNAMEKQITSPVYYIDVLRVMRSNGIQYFVELCAKSVCTSFVKATLGSDVTFESFSAPL